MNATGGEMMSNTMTGEPDLHVGHNIVIDQWARDFAGRRSLGNGWCTDCRCPVALEVIRPGFLTLLPKKKTKP